MTYTFAYENEDLEAMLEDSLHSITVANVTHRCFYDLRGEMGDDMGGAAGPVLGIEVATIKADHFPGLKAGDQVRISGDDGWQQQYVVLRILPSGPMRELLLRRT